MTLSERAAARKGAGQRQVRGHTTQRPLLDPEIPAIEFRQVAGEGGHLLIMNLALDLWVRIAPPTPPGHGYFGHQQDSVRWRRDLADAGFDLVEEGTRPATMYFLATRRPR